MKFTVEKTPIDLDTTQVENIFIEDFMPVANGNFVKVYLYAYKHKDSQSEFQLSNEILATNLNLDLIDVENAWNYWEQEGLVEKYINLDGTYDIKFLSLRSYYIKNISDQNKVPEKSPTDNLVRQMESKSIRAMFNEIDYYMRRTTTPTEKMEILSWISQYNMGPDMIAMAFEYCTEKKGKISVNYVRAVIISWYDKGLGTIEEIEEEIKKSDEKYVRKNKILRKLGLQYRMVSEPEIQLINSWYDQYGYGEDLIDQAIKRTAQIPKPSINYVNSILTKWRKMGIQTEKDIEEKDIKPSPTAKQTKNNFNNFEGQSQNYTEEELNQMAKTIRKRRRSK
ncbi:MAG: DnaD domain protein [Bacillota bacterium]|nr:DnaD domain protein [Bacillota bacterium]